MKTNTTTPNLQKNSFLTVFKESKQHVAYWEELAVLGFTESILKRLCSLGMSKKDLARRMAVSPAHITKLIGGYNNFTLRTMVKMSMAVDCEVDVKLRPSYCNSNWQSYSATTPHKIIVFHGNCQTNEDKNDQCTQITSSQIHANRALAA